MTSMLTLRNLWGPIGQVAYVVTDIESAALRWTSTIGVGPWNLFPHAPFGSFRYNDEPSDADVSLALAFMGDMNLELIQQHNDAPSLYRDLLETYGEGAQHICFYPEDYDAAIAAGIEAGLTVGQEGEIWGVDFVYLQGDAGRVLELARLPPERRSRRETTIAKAATWDGSDPIRIH